MAKRIVKKKAAPKKVAKKSVAPVSVVTELKSGDAFTATYNRKQIQGEVIDDYRSPYDSERSYELGTHKAGEVVNTCDGRGWTRKIDINTDGEVTLIQALKEEGITNFQVVTNKKEKQAILDTALETEIGGFDYTIEDGKVSFGCGAVEVNKKEIQDFLVFRKKADAFFKSNQGKLYQRIDNLIKDNNDESSALDIPEKDINKILAIL